MDERRSRRVAGGVATIPSAGSPSVPASPAGAEASLEEGSAPTIEFAVEEADAVLCDGGDLDDGGERPIAVCPLSVDDRTVLADYPLARLRMAEAEWRRLDAIAFRVVSLVDELAFPYRPFQARLTDAWETAMRSAWRRFIRLGVGWRRATHSKRAFGGGARRFWEGELGPSHFYGPPSLGESGERWEALLLWILLDIQARLRKEEEASAVRSGLRPKWMPPLVARLEAPPEPADEDLGADGSEEGGDRRGRWYVTRDGIALVERLRRYDVGRAIAQARVPPEVRRRQAVAAIAQARVPPEALRRQTARP